MLFSATSILIIRLQRYTLFATQTRFFPKKCTFCLIIPQNQQRRCQIVHRRCRVHILTIGVKGLVVLLVLVVEVFPSVSSMTTAVTRFVVHLIVANSDAMLQITFININGTRQHLSFEAEQHAQGLGYNIFFLHNQMHYTLYMFTCFPSFWRQDAPASQRGGQ